MTGVALEQLVIFVGEVPHVFGQSLIECPKFRRREMLHQDLRLRAKTSMLGR